MSQSTSTFFMNYCIYLFYSMSDNVRPFIILGMFLLIKLLPITLAPLCILYRTLRRYINTVLLLLLLLLLLMCACVCVCDCQNKTVERNNLCPTYLARCFIWTQSKSNSKIKVIVQVQKRKGSFLRQK